MRNAVSKTSTIVFVNVGKKAFEESQNNHENWSPENNNSRNTFRPQPIDTDTIILTIKHLKESNPHGSDNISLRLIKDALPAILPHITCIIGIHNNNRYLS